MVHYDVICERCSTPFHRAQHHSIQTPRFCSVKCSSPGVPKAFTCERCAVTFERYIWGKMREPRYCSFACYRPNNRPKVTCESCGKDFENNRGKNQPAPRYCSRACWSTGATIACKHCGKDFRVNAASATKRTYCSSVCAGKTNAAARRIPAMFCEICDAEIIKQKWVGRRFCSLKCFGVHHSRTRVGPNATNWHGGHEPYYGANWRQQRRNARHRDGYQCRGCGVSEETLSRNLDVHHIVPFREFGRERYKEANTLTNLISLCPTCHTSMEWDSWRSKVS